MGNEKFLCKPATLLFILFIAAISSPVMAIHYTATWTNADSTEKWSDPNNWDIGVVPINLTDTFDVVIPTGFTVYFDIDSPSSVTDFEIALYSTLVINPGHSLTVSDDAVINGKIVAEGNSTAFVASAQGAALGDAAQFYATGGASIGSAAVDYTSNILNSSITLFSADGAGSQLDLSSLQSFSAAFGHYNRTHTVSATNNGVIDMSSVGTIRGPSNGSSRLKMYVGSKGLVNLNSLTDILGGYNTFDIDVDLYTLPSLAIANTTTFDASGTTTISMANLETLQGCSLVIASGGTINAPELSGFTNSTVTLDPAYTLVTGALSNIDNSRIALTGGQEFGAVYGDMTATSYASTSNASYTLFSASGDGTIFDLSSLTSINAGHGHYNRTQTISAVDQGFVDLSNVSTISSPTNSSSRLKFHIDSEGDIDLSSLLELPSGYTYFDIDVPAYTLPLLQTGVGVTLDASNVTTIDVPELTSLAASSIVIDDGGTVNLPMLTSFTNSTVTLDPAYTLVTGALSNIDNSRIALTGGQEFGTVYGDLTATSYASTSSASYTLFSAIGDGTIFDLSSLTSINAGHGHYNRTQTISASDQAVVDLSGVGNMHGPTNSSSALRIAVDSGAKMLFGDNLSADNYTRFELNGPDSIVSISGDFNINAPSKLSVVEGSKIIIGGDFVYDIFDEAAFTTDTAFVTMNGTESILEVASQDLGVSGATASNFGFAQLTIGENSSPATVMLVDLVDNGNRDANSEALYLYGSGGISGLKIRPNSRLIIGDINLYVKVDGEMVHINSLFGPKTKYISFDQGVITRSDYSCSLTADLNGDCFVNLVDLAIMANEWLQCGDGQCD